MDGHSTACFLCGHSPRSPSLKKGQVIAARYELTGVLGSGGMGTVYQAHDRSLDELVALKVLGEGVRGSADADRRFRAEIKLARKVRHPNVCAIHEYGDLPDLQYIVMEFVDGEDLKKYLDSRGALTADEALDIARQIGEGLQAVHDAGVIHRDLKLANVMRDSTGRLRLMDFGIAKRVGDVMSTVTGQILGTPEYMSPEQVQGQPTGLKTDIYSLGVMTFELLTGRVPFRANTPIATIMLHVHAPPQLEDPAIPPAIVPILEKALAKNAEDRYESARAFVAALAAARVSNVPSAAAPVSPQMPAADLTTAAIATPEVAPVRRTEGPPPIVMSPAQEPKAVVSSRHRWGPWLGASGGVLLGLGATVWLGLQVGELARSRPEPKPSQPAIEPKAVAAATEPAVTPNPSPKTPTAIPSIARTVAMPRPTRALPTEKALDPIPETTPTPLSAAAPTPVALGKPTPAPAVTPSPPQTPGPAPTAAPESSTPPAATATGYLELGAAPFAEVTVDGKEGGMIAGTKTLELAVGRHVVRFLHRDYRPLQRIVTILPGKTMKVFVDFGLDGIAK